jgi:hypothetical protein
MPSCTDHENTRPRREESYRAAVSVMARLVPAIHAAPFVVARRIPGGRRRGWPGASVAMELSGEFSPTGPHASQSKSSPSSARGAAQIVDRTRGIPSHRANVALSQIHANSSQ